MELSNQRLGDNPRDRDGQFRGFNPASAADINGLKADADPEIAESLPADADKEEKAWNIYPPPPPPHWHWKPAQDGPKVESSSKTAGLGGPGESSGGRDSHAFNYEDCEIPGPDPREFAINDDGVFEVWTQAPKKPADGATTATASSKGKERLSRVPSLREYYSDLEYLLGVCSDGPAKSFAFRRLKYLSSKWSLYCLLNEYQELADMKVSRQPYGGS